MKKQYFLNTQTEIGLKVKIIAVMLGSVIARFFFGPYSISITESTKIYDRNGVLLYDERKDERVSSYKKFSEIPPIAIEFLIKKEDCFFWYHSGINPFSILRALYKTTVGRTQGASTIAQQVVKLNNNRFNKRTLSDKLYEIIFATRLVLWNSKQEIFTHYVNLLSFGNGVRGLSTACVLYYGNSCNQLSQAQIIYLLVKAHYPSKKSISEKARYRYSTLYEDKQQDSINNHDLTKEDFENAEKSLGRYSSKIAPHFVDFILSQGNKGIVYTTLDYTLFTKIDNIFAQTKSTLQSYAAEDACVIVLKNKQILSMNVLKQYGKEGTFINPCLEERQVGSAIKPFLYALAMKKLNLNENSIIRDEPVSFQGSFEGVYEPKNFTLSYYGDVSLGIALGSSLNIPAVKLLNQIGVTSLLDFLRKIGQIVGTQKTFLENSDQYGLSLALGSIQISPLDFSLMRTFFQDNNTIPDYKTQIDSVKSMLSKNENRILSFPQFNYFNIPNTYVKSGTSRRFVDGRTCGGKKDITVCVRVGNLNAKSMKESGYNTAGFIWNKVMSLFQAANTE